MKDTDLPYTCDDDDCSPCPAEHPVQTVCHCGACCRHLILEVLVEDAEVEPKTEELCSPICAAPEMTASGEQELSGCLLNAPIRPSIFPDRDTNLCTIYETRPLMCRLFN